MPELHRRSHSKINYDAQNTYGSGTRTLFFGSSELRRSHSRTPTLELQCDSNNDCDSVAAFRYMRFTAFPYPESFSTDLIEYFAFIEEHLCPVGSQRVSFFQV